MTKQITKIQVMEHNLEGRQYWSGKEAGSSDMNMTQNINTIKTGNAGRYTFNLSHIWCTYIRYCKQDESDTQMEEMHCLGTCE